MKHPAAKVVACLVILFTPLVAQIIPGSIGGTVTDATGAVVAGVAVSVTGPALIGGARTTTTDASGTYRFLELPPGTYTVRFEKSGFKTFTSQGIVLNTGVQVASNARLDLGEVTQEVTVEALAATIDTEHVTSQSVASQAVMEGIPNGRSPWAIANTIAAVATTTYDVGGSAGMQQAALTAHGSNGSADQKFMIDGVSVNWPGGGGGATLMYYDMGMFQEVNYLVGAVPADVSQGGVYMNMVTKSGGNQVHGRVFLNGSSQGMQTNNVDAALAAKLFNNLPASVKAKVDPTKIIPGNPLTETYDYNGQVGGPIIKDRLWWFTSWRIWKADNLVAGAFNLDGTQALNDNRITDEMGKFDYQINSKNRMSFMYFRNQKNRYHRRNQGSFGDNVTAVLQNQPGYDADVKWTYVPTSRLVLDAGIALTAGKTPYRYQNDIVPGAISVYDTSTLTVYNAAQYNYINPVYRVALDTYASYFASDWWGRHNIKVGLQYSRDGYNQRYTADGDLQGQLINGVPTTALIYNTPVNIQQNNLNVVGLYAEDSWTIKRRLTLNYGLRWERWHGTIPPQTSPAGTFVAARTYPSINGPDWNNWTPRFGFAFDVTGKGKTVIKGSANRYMQGEGMALLADNINPLGFATASVPWTCNLGPACITNGPTLSQLNLAASNGFVGGLTTTLDPNIKRPYSWEESFGVQQQLPGDLILTVMGWYRSTFNQIGRENLAVPSSAYTPVTIKNPLDGSPLVVYNQSPATKGMQKNFITNSRALNNEFRGLDVNFERRMTRRWMLLGGVTWSRYRGAPYGYINSALAQFDDLNNPNFNFNRLGLIATDAPVIFKLGGTYNLPWGVVLSSNFQHVSGYPEWATYTVTSAILGQTLTQNSQLMYIEPSGFNRLPSLNLWDMRFAKEFRLRDRYKIQPEFDIYNLNNSAAVQSVNQSANAGALFLNPTSVLPPRLFKVGLEVLF